MVIDFAGVHNTTVHAATGFTPFFLTYGREAKLPYDLLVEGRDKSSDEPVAVQEWAERYAQLVSDARSAARQHQGDREYKKQMRDVLVAKTMNPPPVFKVGQQVLVDKRHRGPGQKKEATALWTGPYRVVGKVSDIVYLVDRGGREPDYVHVDRIKRYHTAEVAHSVRLTQRSEGGRVTGGGAGVRGSGTPGVASDGDESSATGFEDLDTAEGDPGGVEVGEVA